MSNYAAKSFGDVRSLIIETIVDLRERKMDANLGMALAANFKVLNDNIQVEVNVTKLAILTEGKAHQFGKVMRMGTRQINEQLPESALDTQV